MRKKKEVAGKVEGEKVGPKMGQRMHSHLPQKNTSLAKTKRNLSWHRITVPEPISLQWPNLPSFERSSWRYQWSVQPVDNKRLWSDVWLSSLIVSFYGRNNTLLFVNKVAGCSIFLLYLFHHYFCQNISFRSKPLKKKIKEKRSLLSDDSTEEKKPKAVKLQTQILRIKSFWTHTIMEAIRDFQRARYYSDK